jgi:hypothetical protein
MVNGQWSLGKRKRTKKRLLHLLSAFQRFSVSEFQLLPQKTPIIISRYDDLILEITALEAIFPA